MQLQPYLLGAPCFCAMMGTEDLAKHLRFHLISLHGASIWRFTWYVNMVCFVLNRRLHLRGHQNPRG